MRAPERARVLRRKKKGREEEKGRKNERMKKRNGGARRAVDVTRMEQHRRFRYIRRVSLFPTRRSHRRDVYRVFFFFSPLPFRIKRTFVIVCPRCAMGERVTRRRKRKIGTGNMEGI